MVRRHVLVLGVLLFVFSGVASVSAEVRYTVTDLGTLNGVSSTLRRGMSAGQVVGYSRNPGTPIGQPATVYAFLYSGGTMADLGNLGGSISDAYGVNASGAAIGYSTTVTGATLAFLAQNGGMNDLGTLDRPPSAWSKAYGINDGGAVVGCASDASGNTAAFLYHNGTMTPLGIPSGYTQSEAYGIDSAGEVVGNAYTGDGSTTRPHSLFDNGTTSDLGALPGPNGHYCRSRATAIHAAGIVVGASSVWSLQVVIGGNPEDVWTETEHAWLWSDGTATDLGTPSGCLWKCANAVNAAGEVVGVANTANGEPFVGIGRAFLYKDGAITDLNTLIDPASGWSLYNAAAINDSGLIVGYGRNANLKTHAFLLTPLPEPSTAALTASGLAAALLAVWRRRGSGAGSRATCPAGRVSRRRAARRPPASPGPPARAELMVCGSHWTEPSAIRTWPPPA